MVLYKNWEFESNRLASLIIGFFTLCLCHSSQAVLAAPTVSDNGSCNIGSFCELGTVITTRRKELLQLAAEAQSEAITNHDEKLSFTNLALHSKAGTTLLIFRREHKTLVNDYVVYETDQEGRLINRMRPIVRTLKETSYLDHFKPPETFLVTNTKPVATDQVNLCLALSAEAAATSANHVNFVFKKAIPSFPAGKAVFYLLDNPAQDDGYLLVVVCDAQQTEIISEFEFNPGFNEALIDRHIEGKEIPIITSLPPGDPVYKGKTVEDSQDIVELAEAATCYFWKEFHDPIAHHITRNLDNKLFLVFQSGKRSDTDYFLESDDGKKINRIYDPTNSLR